MKRIFTIIGYHVLIFSHIFLLYVGYLYFFDGLDAVRYQELPYKTSQDVYHTGQFVKYRGVVCKTEIYPISAVRSMHRVDDKSQIEIQIDIVTSGTTTVGCVHFTSFPAKIEEGTPPGIYRIQGTTFVQVNAVANRSFKWRTQDFQILP